MRLAKVFSVGQNRGVVLSASTTPDALERTTTTLFVNRDNFGLNSPSRRFLPCTRYVDSHVATTPGTPWWLCGLSSCWACNIHDAGVILATERAAPAAGRPVDAWMLQLRATT